MNATNTLDDAGRALTHTDAILELLERYIDGRDATAMEALDLARRRLRTVFRCVDALECEAIQENNAVAGKVARRSRKTVSK